MQMGTGTEANGYDDKRSTKAKGHSDMETTEGGPGTRRLGTDILLSKRLLLTFYT